MPRSRPASRIDVCGRSNRVRRSASYCLAGRWARPSRSGRADARARPGTPGLPGRAALPGRGPPWRGNPPAEDCAVAPAGGSGRARWRGWRSRAPDTSALRLRCSTAGCAPGRAVRLPAVRLRRRRCCRRSARRSATISDRGARPESPRRPSARRDSGLQFLGSNALSAVRRSERLRSAGTNVSSIGFLFQEISVGTGRETGA